MTTIKMTKTRRASQDCWTVELFKEGRSYTVTNSLAGQFIREGSATAIID